MTEELLREAGRGDGAAMERMLLENSGLIWSIARRYFGRGAEPDDLYQLGCVGFIKAVRGFDAGFGTQFSTYAVPKIAGEIRRFLRDDGPVKVSRTLRERAASIRAAREKLVWRLGREPVLSELSAECGLSVEEIAEAELSAGPVESLQRENAEEVLTLEGALGMDGPEENILERLTLREAVEQLPERERGVIALRFYRGMTQDKTARVLGVSQVQVSRIERKALEILRRLVE